jgi:hypothetical protein
MEAEIENQEKESCSPSLTEDLVGNRYRNRLRPLFFSANSFASLSTMRGE